VNGFLTRRLEGEWPYLWLDATYLKVRAAGRIVSVAAIICIGLDRIGQLSDLGVRLRTSDRSDQQAAGMAWLC
jgi:transposase-like protein